MHSSNQIKSFFYTEEMQAIEKYLSPKNLTELKSVMEFYHDVENMITSIRRKRVFQIIEKSEDEITIRFYRNSIL